MSEEIGQQHGGELPMWRDLYTIRITKPWREAWSFGGSIDKPPKRPVYIISDYALYPLQVSARDYFARYFGFSHGTIINGKPHAETLDYCIEKMRNLNISCVNDFLYRAPFIRWKCHSANMYSIPCDWMIKFLNNNVFEHYIEGKSK